MDHRINSKRNCKRLGAHEIKKFNVKLSKINLDEIMEALDTYKAEYEALDLITITSSSIIRFNDGSSHSSLSIQERIINKKEFDLAKMFFNRLEYLTEKILTEQERIYFLNTYYDHLSRMCIQDNITHSDADFRNIRNSSVIKAALFFHCAVRIGSNEEQELKSK